MKELTLEQNNFLHKVIRLHDDRLSTYINLYSIFTMEIYDSGEYNHHDIMTLNKVGDDYKVWKLDNTTNND